MQINRLRRWAGTGAHPDNTVLFVLLGPLFVAAALAAPGEYWGGSLLILCFIVTASGMVSSVLPRTEPNQRWWSLRRKTLLVAVLLAGVALVAGAARLSRIVDGSDTSNSVEFGTLVAGILLAVAFVFAAATEFGLTSSAGSDGVVAGDDANALVVIVAALGGFASAFAFVDAASYFPPFALASTATALAASRVFSRAFAPRHARIGRTALWVVLIAALLTVLSNASFLLSRDPADGFHGDSTTALLWGSLTLVCLAGATASVVLLVRSVGRGDLS